MDPRFVLTLAAGLLLLLTGLTSGRPGPGGEAQPPVDDVEGAPPPDA